MDVLFIGGLENIVKGYKTQSIVRALKHLVDLVTWQGEHFHPGIPNTCGIATLFYPPKLCNLNKAANDPSNKLAAVQELNKEIEILNAKSGRKVPNFTTFGLRKGKAKTKHRWEHWQGSAPRDMLYLKEELLVKMGRQVGKYFDHETEQ